jgi:hypothetical protein
VIDALIGGKLFGAATERSGQSGKTFVIAKVRAADSDGKGQFANVVAFDGSVKAALLALVPFDNLRFLVARQFVKYLSQLPPAARRKFASSVASE